MPRVLVIGSANVDFTVTVKFPVSRKQLVRLTITLLTSADLLKTASPPINW